MTRPEHRRRSRAEGTVGSYARALAQVAKLERENAQLRLALQSILKDVTGLTDSGEECEACLEKESMARAALTQKEDV